MWLLVSLLSLLLGSLVGGVLYSRARGQDIRAADLPGGSGSWRQYGPAAGIGVAFFDGLKGTLSVYLAHLLMPNDAALGAALATSFAVLGHCYPPLLGYRGGGGIATLIGALALAAPSALLQALGAAVLFIPIYKLFLQKFVGLNVVPVAAGVAVPVLLWRAWQGGHPEEGGFWAALAGSLVMAGRAAHLVQQDARKEAAEQGD